FLAGEFPDCVFIFGMDAEMIAAALEKAHSNVIAKLPGYAAGTAVGWRFMDKFLQLPFVIPPPEASDLAEYVTSPFEEEATTKSLPREIRVRIDEAARNLEPEKVSEVVQDVSRFVTNRSEERRVGKECRPRRGRSRQKRKEE